jgi:glycosyltransferase involved in cell wall biosynthesis
VPDLRTTAAASSGTEARRLRRIGMFVHVLDDRAVSRLNRALCGQFASAGLQTVLICATRSPSAVIAVPNGVSVRNLRLGRRPTGFGVVRLTSLLHELQLDVLFAHGNGPSRTAILARMLARASTRVVAVEHNHYSTFYKRRMWLRDRLTPLLYARADRVAGVSSGVVEDLETRFPALRGKTIVLPSLGPDPSELPALLADEPDHPWFAQRGGARLMCSVGNLVPRKGQATLVEALALVRKEAGDVRLVLVGRFDDQEFVSQLRRRIAELGISDDVWLAGYRANALPYIARADVFVLASETEGAPMVLTEAMACGVPVVSTDCPSGPAYLLDYGRCGLLVPVGDSQQLATAVVGVLQNAGLREELVARGRERASQFTAERVAERYLALAHSLLAERLHFNYSGG